MGEPEIVTPQSPDDRARTSRGPKRLVTREVLLEAGARLLRRRSSVTNVAAAFDVRLADVLAEASVLLSERSLPTKRGAVAPTALYREWPQFDDYVRELTAYVRNDLSDWTRFPVSADLWQSVSTYVSVELPRRSDQHTTLALVLSAANPDESGLDVSASESEEATLRRQLDESLRLADRRFRGDAAIGDADALALMVLSLLDGLSLRVIKRGAEPDAQEVARVVYSLILDNTRPTRLPEVAAKSGATWTELVADERLAREPWILRLDEVGNRESKERLLDSIPTQMFEVALESNSDRVRIDPRMHGAPPTNERAGEAASPAEEWS